MKKVNNIKHRKIEESEHEELIRLRAEIAYIKAECEIIKKCLERRKMGCELKAKKQQLSKNLKKKDTN